MDFQNFVSSHAQSAILLDWWSRLLQHPQLELYQNIKACLIFDYIAARANSELATFANSLPPPSTDAIEDAKNAINSTLCTLRVGPTRTPGGTVCRAQSLTVL